MSKHVDGPTNHCFLAGRHKQWAKSQTALENSNNTDRHRCSQHHIHCYVQCPEEVLKGRRRSFHLSEPHPASGLGWLLFNSQVESSQDTFPTEASSEGISATIA